MLSDLELAWLAGLLEGEGCFKSVSAKYCRPVIQLMMTDADVVVRAAKAMGAYKVLKCKTPTKSGKAIYRVNLYGGDALLLMERLLPLMGDRRSAKIRSILEMAATRPASRYPNRRPYSRGAELVWAAN